MAFKTDKIVKILLNEVDNVEERCRGYKNELKQTLGDIVYDEYRHSIARIDIIKKIEDKVDAMGQFHYKNTDIK